MSTPDTPRQQLRVDIETTVPSYLTAWPSGNLIRAAQQRQTALWWARRAGYELFGYEPPTICTPGDLLAEGAEDG